MNRQSARERVIDLTDKLLFLPIQSLKVLDDIRVRTVTESTTWATSIFGRTDLAIIASDLMLTGTEVNESINQLRKSQFITEEEQPYLTEEGIDACCILPVVMRELLEECE